VVAFICTLRVVASSFQETLVDELTSDDLICIPNDKVILPYVLANSEYETPTKSIRSECKIVYRIPTLEKQVRIELF